MANINLYSDIQYLRGVGPKLAEKLKKLSITTPADLLHHYPRYYIDYFHPRPISSIKIGEIVVIRGKISQLSIKKSPRRRMTIIDFLVSDDRGQMKVIYFNQPFLAKNFIEGEEFYFSGRVGYDFQAGLKNLASPLFSKEATIVPVYPETANVNSKYLSRLVDQVINLNSKIEDFLPSEVIKSADLLPIDQAIKLIHQPQIIGDTERARRRLAFEELYLQALQSERTKIENRSKKAPLINHLVEDLKLFTDQLEFKLTGAQKKAAWQIVLDLKTGRPMNRLLNGDVGSGKTVVGAMAIFVAIQAGYQAILMAPTEILAFQHYQTIKKLPIFSKLKIGLVTGSRKEIDGKKTGDFSDCRLLVGTHALIQDTIKYDNVALVIVDEQHRFGVDQRRKLQEKVFLSGEKNRKLTPHFLSMTATPIPRTLQLTLFGNLDISIIDELPPGRKKVETRLYEEKQRQEAYKKIRGQIKIGRQAFVICPLIEESNQQSDRLFDDDKKSVLAEYKKLKESVFPEFRIGLIHGKLRPKEKQEAIESFNNGRTDILVSTSVVEVGVNVPNATVMMIESAERFGLAQLHQFRGRVLRSDHQAFCFLMTESRDPKIKERLQSLERYSSGFKLAEIDLKNRGPGEIFGQEQSGFSNLRLEWVSDIFLLEESREEAKKTIKRDPSLNSYPILKSKLRSRFSVVHLE